jgi:hypothetical protein
MASGSRLGPTAIRLIAAKGQTPATVQLLCRVKPGVSADRQGIAAVDEDCIVVCVAAQPRDGLANRAVEDVIAHALKVPKSDVAVTKGMKGREKTVAVRIDTKVAGGDVLDQIKNNLLGSVSR